MPQHPASAFLHRRRVTPTKLHPTTPPDAIAANYAIALRAMIRSARALTAKHLMPMLGDIVAKTDHVDADEPKSKIKSVVSRMLVAWHKQWDGPRITKAVSATAAAVNAHSERELFKQIKSGLGISLEHATDNRMKKRIDQFTEENVALIRTVPEQYFDQVQQVVLDGVANGRRADAIADDLVDRVNVAESRAKLIASDQVKKFNAGLTEARHRDLGISKYTWRRMPGAAKVPREEHIEREGNVYSYDDPPGDEDDPEEGGNPGVAINCFLGSMPMRLFETSVVRAYRRIYRGDLTELVSDDGRLFPSTPNHPLLTPRGWVAPHLIEIGEHVLEACGKVVDPRVEDAKRADPAIEQVFGALALFGRPEIPVRLASGWFHGDAAIDEEVDVVDVNWRLLVKPYAGLSQCFCEQLLARASDVGACERPLDNSVDGLIHSSRSNVRCGCDRGALFGGHVPAANQSGLGAVAWLKSISDELRSDGCAYDAEEFRDGLHRHAGLRQGDNLLSRVLLGVWGRTIDGPLRGDAPSAELLGQIVSVHADDRRDLRDRVIAKQSFRVAEKRIRHLERSTHVYNLQTSTGWYVAQNLICGNCTCYAEPFLDDILSALDED